MKNKVIIDNIRIPVSCGDGDILSLAEKKLKTAGISYDRDSLHIHKKSVDARKRNNITFVCSAVAETMQSECKAENIRIKISEEYKIQRGTEILGARPIVVGFGPAGIFCALSLAEAGLRPLVLERGSCVRKRIDAIENFYTTGKLDTDCNIQFGAGGAGTFSDGKLTTRIGDHRCEYVLEKLHKLGAPDDIMWRAKPHIGTDILRNVVENADKTICQLGGEIRYDTKVISVGENYVETEEGRIEAGCVILATGHSARDIYSMLVSNGFAMEAKPFSVGVRAEHLQVDIDTALYGDPSLSEKLGHGEYQMSYRKGDRGVYTFCMCPGGEVMAATSELGGVVTNGMSRYARDGKNANAAVAVSVLPSDFNEDPMKAIDFQRNLEQSAYKAGGSTYAAPCQLMGDFLEGRKGRLNSRIAPSYMNGNVTPCNLAEVLPVFVTDMLQIGFKKFGGTIRGYDAKDVPLTGIETRTSAPVRILRGESFSALGFKNIYPCGEGAGYAGGIMSAAVDGLRVAEAILSRFKQ